MHALKLVFTLFLSSTTISMSAMAMTFDEAIREARKNLFQRDQLSSEAKTLLESYRQPYTDNDQFIYVFMVNSRGQYVPVVVQRSEWDRPQGRRLVVNPRTPVADQIQWAKENGQVVLQTCQDETLASCRTPQKPAPEDRTCHANSVLPKGLTFDQLVQPGFDCLSDRAKQNDFLSLACNLYFESRGEGSLGRSTVAEITMNRVMVNRSNNREQRSVSQVVHAPDQFSWTKTPAVVTFNNNSSSTDRRAWLDSLTIAASYLNGNSEVDPVVFNPNLTCYTYYLSLDRYKKRDDFPKWAQSYYDRTITGPDSQKPLCVGRHIFLKNPDLTCDGSQNSHDPELDDKKMVFYNDFYRNCLHAETEHALPGPSSPDLKICSAVDFSRAVNAQHDDYNIPGVNPGIEQVESRD